MKAGVLQKAAIALAATGLVISAPVEAKTQTVEAKTHRHYRHVRKDPGHGDCLRFNKTTGAVAGGVGGAVIGKVLLGGPIGLIAGAAAGGIAGHKLARNGKKHCR